MSEINKIEKVAEKVGKVANVRFRVKPNMPDLNLPSDFLEESVPINVATQMAKFGIV